MSIYDQIATSGRDVGAGYLAGVKNKYALQERERSRQEAGTQRARNEFVQDRSFDLQKNQYALQNQRYEAGQAQQATKDQMAFGKDTMAILSKVPPGQRQQAYMARVDEAARTVGLPEGFNPEQGWAAIESQIPPLERRIEADAGKRKRFVDTGERVFPGEQQPSALDTAKLRKEQALAQGAELKVSDAENKAREAKATKTEITDLAASLLTKNDAGEYELADGVSRVYGDVDRFLPSFGEAYSAEADIDRLVDILTLGNMDKMTGILSDSDIKILRNAGTILGRKGLPEKRALVELKKVAKVFDKLQETEQIDALMEKYGDPGGT